MRKPDCPVCGEGYLTEHVDQCIVEYRGVVEARPSWFSVCSECGSEVATAEQMRRNKRDTVEYQERVDRLFVLQ